MYPLCESINPAPMVLILDGNSEKCPRKKQSFLFDMVKAFGCIESSHIFCLRKYLYFFMRTEHNSELSSDISTLPAPATHILTTFHPSRVADPGGLYSNPDPTFGKKNPDPTIFLPN